MNAILSPLGIKQPFMGLHTVEITYSIIQSINETRQNKRQNEYFVIGSFPL